jgi:hypothetical protein
MFRFYHEVHKDHEVAKQKFFIKLRVFSCSAWWMRLHKKVPDEQPNAINEAGSYKGND